MAMAFVFSSAYRIFCRRQSAIGAFLQSPRLEQGVGGVHMPQCRSVQIGITGDTGKLCGQAFSGEKETAVRPKRPRTGWDEERFC